MVDLSPKTVLEESVQDVGDVLATIKDNIDAKSYLWVESLIGQLLGYKWPSMQKRHNQW